MEFNLLSCVRAPHGRLLTMRAAKW